VGAACSRHGQIGPASGLEKRGTHRHANAAARRAKAHQNVHESIIREPARGSKPGGRPVGARGPVRYAASVVPSAGILIIGNEILSGKIQDTNSPYLCRQLRALGVDVERILTIPDEVEVIAAEVKAMTGAYDFVFTSGGIGPTHDDLTMEGVAAAFGRAVVRNESIAGRLKRAQGGKAPDEHQLKMARVPEGATLVDAGDLWFPAIILENVYIFPGVPELLRKKFESIQERFRGVPFALKRVYVKERESDLVPMLDGLLRSFPRLMLGSYPHFDQADYHVLLTLESRDEDYLKRALDSLLESLPRDAIHKVE
jgi:molybdenum cofactor synthesis domain-containing protein